MNTCMWWSYAFSSLEHTLRSGTAGAQASSVMHSPRATEGFPTAIQCSASPPARVPPFWHVVLLIPPRLKAWSLGRGLRGTCAFLSLPHSAKILPRKAVLVPTRPPLGDKHLELTRPALASPDTSCPSQGPQVSLWGVGLESTQLWGDLVGQVAWAQRLPLGGWLRQRPPGLGAQGGSSVHGFILGKPWSYPELLSL